MASTESKSAEYGSNNPFRRPDAVLETEQTSRTEEQQSLDSEKQLASTELLSGPDNGPTAITSVPSMQEAPEVVREADKEVTSSWQTQSREQSAPIPMAYHESQAPGSPRADRFFNDVKGPPPAYDAAPGQSAAGASNRLAPVTTPTSIEPDSPDDVLPPRPEDRSAVGQLLSWIPRAPQSRLSSTGLVLPITIPQLDVPPQGESVPFQRCYSDALAACGVSMQDFARFLDGLEVAQLPGSGLQGLRMFGVGVTHVPIPILATMTGKGISALASSGSGHSGSRARLYLEQARERFFKPRGLRLAIVKDGDLDPRLQIPAHAPQLGALTQNTLSASCVQRRMEALSPYTAPLRFDVPDQDKQIQGVQKMARKHLRSRFLEKRKRIDTLRKRQWEQVPSTPGIFDEKYRGKLSEIRDVQSRMIREAHQPGSQEKGSQFEHLQEELRLKQHELQLIVAERQSQGRDDVAVAAEMDELNWTRRLKWLVIENA